MLVIIKARLSFFVSIQQNPKVCWDSISSQVGGAFRRRALIKAAAKSTDGAEEFLKYLRKNYAFPWRWPSFV